MLGHFYPLDQNEWRQPLQMYKICSDTHLSFISELISRVPQGGYGEYIYQVSPLWQQKFRSIFKKVKQWIFHCIFKKWFYRRRVHFLTIFFSEKAKHLKICLSLGGSMPEAQIWKVRNNPRYRPPPTPHLRIKMHLYQHL